MPKVIDVPFCEILYKGVKHPHFNPRLFKPDFVLGRDRHNKSKIHYARTHNFFISQHEKCGVNEQRFVVFDKKQEYCAKFLGIAVIGHSDVSGEAQIALMLSPESWRQYKATEISLLLMLMIDKLAQEYPITNPVKRFDAQTNKEYYTQQTERLTMITASGKPGKATAHMLQQIGFQQVGTSNIYGEGDNIRQIWSISVPKIKQILDQTNNLSAIRQKIRPRL